MPTHKQGTLAHKLKIHNQKKTKPFINTYTKSNKEQQFQTTTQVLKEKKETKICK